MSPWLQTVSRMNPLTYEVDAFRALMIRGGTSQFGLPLDFAVLIGLTAVLVMVGAWFYPRVADNRPHSSGRIIFPLLNCRARLARAVRPVS